MATASQIGKALTINNSAGAILNWQTFSIKADELVRFNQPSAASSVLNRVLAADPSVIYGQLSSNGKVFLINPAGILVGAGAKIDTAGFVASTLGISNSDFLAGKLNFKADGSAGSVINQGEITTPLGGNVYLIGSQVTNQGLITTPQGETILAAGATVSLIDTATPGVKVDITGAEGNVTNLGQITADAGRIGMAGVLVRNSGQLNASSVVNQGGRIFLKASQDVTVDGSGRIVTSGGSGGGSISVEAGDTAIVKGRVEATANKGEGGSIDILGDKVGLLGHAYVDASGGMGGGTIRIGGDYQGNNPDVRNASFTYVGSDTTIKANASKVSAGGTAIIWADDTTRAYGRIEAKGGRFGGDGGFVEVSGKKNLDFLASVDVSATRGAPGTLLLDPGMLWVADFGGSMVQIGDPAFPFAAMTKSIATVSPAALAAVGGNVSLAATDELVIDDPINLTAPGAGLTATSGKLLIVTPGSTITTNGGAISLTGGTVSAPSDATNFPLLGVGSCVSECWAEGSLLVLAALNSNGGAIDLRAEKGDMYVRSAVSSGGGVISVDVIQSGSTLLTRSFDQPVLGGSGSVSGAGSFDAGSGALSITAPNISLGGTLAGSGGIDVDAVSTLNMSSVTSISAIGGNVMLDGSSVSNSAAISAANVDVTGGGFSNSGAIAATSSIGINVTGTVTLNSGGSLNAGTGSIEVYGGSNILFNAGATASGGIWLKTTGGSITATNSSAIINFGAGNLNFEATSTINADELTGTGTVSASSTSSSVTLITDSGSLKVGTVSALSGTATLRANGNLEIGTVDASTANLQTLTPGGAITATSASSKVTANTVSLTTLGTVGAIGSVALPLSVDTQSLTVDADAAVNIGFPGSPTKTLSSVSLTLDAANLGATSSIAGGPVLGSGLVLTNSAGLVTAAVNPTGTLSSFTLKVTSGTDSDAPMVDLDILSLSNVTSATFRSDGALDLPTANLSGLTLQSYESSINVGTVTGLTSTFSADAFNGPITLGSVTGTSGARNVTAGTGLTATTLSGTSASLTTYSGNLSVDTMTGLTSTFSATASNGAVTLGTVSGTTGARNVNAATGIAVSSVSGGSVTFETTTGNIVAASDDPAAYEINVTGSASLYAYNGSIGGANSFEIKSGGNVTLMGGGGGSGGVGSIGSVAKPIELNTTGQVSLTTSGSFNVIGKNESDALLSFSRLTVDMTAAGIGGTSSVVSANFPLSNFAGNAFAPTSSGTTITLPDLVNHTITSGLYLYVSDAGNVNFGQVQAATGLFYLSTDSGMVTQASGKHVVMGSNAVSIYGYGGVGVNDVVSSGTLNLAANGSGATLHAGNLSSTSTVTLQATSTGGMIDVGTVTTSGSISMTAGQSLSAGALAANGSVFARATNGDLTVAGGTGSVYGGSYVQLRAGNTVSVGAVTSGTNLSGWYVDLDADNGDLIVNGAVQAYGAIDLNANGALQAASVKSYGGHVNAVATNGALTIMGAIENGAGVNDVYVTSGGALTTGNITSSRSITAYAGNNALQVGDLVAGSSGSSTVELSGSSVQLFEVTNSVGGNVGNLYIYPNQGIADADVTGPNGLRANNLNIYTYNATGTGIDLGTVPVVANSVSLNSGDSNIHANLTGASSLYISTGGMFDIQNSTALSSLSVSGHAAGLGTSLLVAPTQTYSFSTNGSGDLQVGIATPSSLDLSLNVSELAGKNLALNNVNTAGGTISASSYSGGIIATNLSSSGGSIYLWTESGTLTASGVSSYGGTISLQTGNGDIQASGVSAASGDLFVASNYAGNVTATNVNAGYTNLWAEGGTLTVDDIVAGYTDLRAHGSISLGDIATTNSNASGDPLYVRSTAGSITPMVGTALSVGTSSVTLEANNGSIGGASAPIAIDVTSNLSQLHLRARDDVAVHVLNGVSSADLAHLDLTLTGTSASSTLDISALNLPVGFLTRSASNLSVSGGATPNLVQLDLVNQGGDLALNGNLGGSLQNVWLWASGTMTIDGNIAASGSLNLSANADLRIVANGGPRTLSGGTYFSLFAGNDMLLAGGDIGGESLMLSSAGGGTNNLQAGRDIVIDADAGGATVNMGSGSLGLYGRDIVVRSGMASASVTTTGHLSVNAFNGGTQGFRIEAEQAAASVQAGSMEIAAYNGLSVLGGTVANASASLTSTGYQELIGAAGSSITVAAGNAEGAHARIWAGGYQDACYYYCGSYFDNLTLTAGNALNAYAEMGSATTQYLALGHTVSLAGGGAAGASAKLLATGGQNIWAGSGISLTGGSSTSGTTLTQIKNSGSGFQYVATTGHVVLTGGGQNSEVAIDNAGSDGQFVYGEAGLSLTGGTQNATVKIINAGGTQTVRAVGGGVISLQSVAGAGAGAVLAIEQNGSAQQTIQADGGLSLLNDHSPGVVRIYSAGNQDVEASSIELRIGSGNTGSDATAMIEAGGIQDVWAETLLKVAALGGGTASIKSGGSEQSIGVLTFTAGAPTGSMLLGDASAAGTSSIQLTSSGFQEIVAASGLDVLSGTGTSKIDSAGTQAVSVLAGGLTLAAATDGTASIDPVTPEAQEVIANNTISMTNANITGSGASFVVNTLGNLSLSGTSKIESGSLIVASIGNVTLGSGTEVKSTSPGTLYYGGSLSNSGTLNNVDPMVLPVFLAAETPVETPQVANDVINSLTQAAEGAPTDLALVSPSTGSTDPTGSTTQTSGGEEGTFGGGEEEKSDDKKDDKKDAKGEEGKDGKKDDGKGAGKKVAQCS